MTQAEWKERVRELSQSFPIKLRAGADESSLSQAERTLGAFPEDLRSFYKVTNGLMSEWFNVLPIEQPESIDKTCDGLKRANNQETTKFLGRNRELLNRFLVIAAIGGPHCACIDRQDASIWFQDVDGLHQTDLTFFEFLETTLREVEDM